ncbi:MAG: SufE family protein [Rhodospirillaceae bacterium]
MHNCQSNEELIYIEPELSIDGLIENFELIDDWEERYRYIIDLGRKLPPFPNTAKTDSFKVKGCMSQVWMVPGRLPDDPDRFTFAADSDAHIVKGLIHILAIMYCGKTTAEILSIEIDEAFARLGLDQHLSPSRRNGVVSMVNRIRTLTD